MSKIDRTSFTYNPRKPLFVQLRAQLPASAKALRKELPDWFAHLVQKGVISRGIVRAVKTDASILLRFQKILKISEFSVSDAGEINIKGELVSDEVVKLLEGKPGSNETAMNLFLIESRFIFATEEEHALFRAFPQAAPFHREIVVADIIRPPITQRDISYAPENFGVITEGIIPRKVYNDGSIKISRDLPKIYVASHFPKGEVPSIVNIIIALNKILVLNTQDEVILEREINHPEGLRVDKPNSYLRRFGPNIRGYFFAKVHPDGILPIAGKTLKYPLHIGNILKITFNYGKITVWDVPDEISIEIFRLTPQEQEPDENQRIVHHDGSFQYQGKTLYLDRQYSGEAIIIHEKSGRIAKIEKLNGEEIPLSALIITYFYSSDGQLQEIMPVWNHFSTKRLGKRSGFHLIGQRQEGSVSYFGKPYSVDGEYSLIAAVFEQGKICGFRYFNNELANPTDPPDHETFRKRAYLHSNSLLFTFGDLKGKAAQRIFAEEAVKITHWQVPKYGRIEITGKKIYLKNYIDKWTIILLANKAGKLICRVYNTPETNPQKEALHEKTVFLK
jgi:hypothetical protein